MLVDLRADAGDFPAAYLLTQLDDKQLQANYDTALAKTIESTGGKLQEDIAAGIVSEIAGQVLAQVAIRLGVRAGILGAGAATGTFTLGVGLVVGLIVDRIVSLVWDWYSDPKANLAGEIDKKLDEMNRLLVDGSTDVKGLRESLRASAPASGKESSSASFNLWLEGGTDAVQRHRCGVAFTFAVSRRFPRSGKDRAGTRSG